ncbi:hypothetical protein C8R45DRAFT_947071 [Mycena sanguinolenta]|nr:hypothetical protein C8R45DRAFT_947071 [Mycena sanguinolenta]
MRALESFWMVMRPSRLSWLRSSTESSHRGKTGETLLSGFSAWTRRRSGRQNDYQPKDHTECQIVRPLWFGHPHDIRARKLVVRWDQVAPLQSDIRTRAIEQARPVLRWNYVCAAHELAAQEEEESKYRGSGSIAAAEGDDSDTASDEGDESGVYCARWKSVFEVTADDLAVVKIFQKGKHDEASAQQMGYLMFSRFLRLQIMDRFRRFGAKVTAVQRDLIDQFLLPSSTGPTEPLPPCRIPTAPQIPGMLSATKQRTRLAVNPFLATWLMVKGNTRDMYNYNPHDFDRPDSESKFTVAITDDFSLDSTILNTAAPNGTIFVDSTHRLRNENWAATTAVCTADEGNHVMPGEYKTQFFAETIKHFFVETVHKIEARAREVAADKSKIQYRDAATYERVFARFQDITQYGFNFTNINIDKSRSELNGLLRALRELKIENPRIRLCQFHVILAILRFDFDDGHQGLGFSIPISVKAEILVLFHKLQRCRSWDSWEETKRIFHAGLRELLGDSDPESLTEQAATEQVEATQDDPVPEPAPTELCWKPFMRCLRTESLDSFNDEHRGLNFPSRKVNQTSTVFQVFGLYIIVDRFDRRTLDTTGP